MSHGILARGLYYKDQYRIVPKRVVLLQHGPKLYS